jgi:subtilisin
VPRHQCFPPRSPEADQSWSGTAGACAHVSGAAAVAWGAHRFATNVEIRNLMAGTAKPLGAPGWDPQYGYGRVRQIRRRSLGRLLPLPL